MNHSERKSVREYVYFGTYTQKWPEKTHRREGIYIYRYNPANAALTFSSAVEGVTNPSFLAISPDRGNLYAVNEGEGQVSAFSVDSQTGHLTFLNQQPTDGTAPCYVSVDPTDRWVLVSNFGTGSLAVFPILADGKLGLHSDLVQHYGTGPDSSRQEKAHAHSVIFDPSGNFALAADLGIDQVLVYRFDYEKGKLIPNNPPGVNLSPGAGPRHMAFHLNRKVLYVASELNSTVTACHWDAANGLLTPFQTLSTLPAGWDKTSYVADIHLATSGKYLYVSNRGHHSLACYRVAPEGLLEYLGNGSTGGEWPRNFAILPASPDSDNQEDLILAANEHSHNVVAFRVPAETGLPLPTGLLPDSSTGMRIASRYLRILL